MNASGLTVVGSAAGSSGVTSSGTTVADQASGTSGASSTVLYMSVGIVMDSSNNMYFTYKANYRVMYWANGASFGTVIAGITG